MLKSKLLLVSFLFLVISCEMKWEDHYDSYQETVTGSVWEVMQSDTEISEFVQILKDLQYDTLFFSDFSYTLFVPTNDALARYMNENSVGKSLVDYLISSHFIQSGSIGEKRFVQTLSEKFALFEKYGNELKMDGVLLRKESPLYRNGKYFLMDEVVEPLPNLYEYYSVNNPVLKDYIDSQDSIILDREKSKPIGYDENGKTVFDSVIVKYNKFEAEYFEVSKEFRNKRVTFVFPRKEEYEDALTVLAQRMNIPGYVDYRDIPIDWQYSVLMPYLFRQGIFGNLLEPEDFVGKSAVDTLKQKNLKLKNIQGDSIIILYTPGEKAISSNGYAYEYSNFEIPDSLYAGSNKFEMEWLLDNTGINRYAWKSNVNDQYDQFFRPSKEFNSKASNDSILSVLFTKGYNGKFSIEFDTKKLFPRKYLMVVKTHMNVGGIYDIYVNDELVRTFDYYDFVKYRQIIPSVIPGKRYLPDGLFNSFDMWVDNIEEYGRIKVRFEYMGPSFVFTNGLAVDYIDLIPADN